MSGDEAVRLAREALKTAYPETDDHHALATAVLALHAENERLRAAHERVLFAGDAAQLAVDRLRAALATLTDGIDEAEREGWPGSVREQLVGASAEMRREWKIG